MDLAVRYKTHLINSSRPERGGSTKLYSSIIKYDYSNFTWSPICITNSHLNRIYDEKLWNLFNLDPQKERQNLNLSEEEIYILRCFSKYESMLHEQSLID